ncbi:hypothetical protein JCM8547_005629 [Rhodosporidiobolus lusitaniae]
MDFRSPSSESSSSFPPSSSPISRLAPELLVKIFQFAVNELPLEQKEASGVLSTPRAHHWSQFCLVSKSWLEWWEPELYREVPLRFNLYSGRPPTSPHQAEHEVAPLYQQLVTTPCLAALVRYLNLRNSSLETNEEQGALGYLLSCLPNLVGFELPGSGINSAILDGILRDLACRTLPLQTLSLVVDGDHGGYSSDALARFERLEELRVLFFPCDHLFSSRFTRPTFNLTTLQLDRSITPSDFLALTSSSQSSLSSLSIALSALHPGYCLADFRCLRSRTLSPHPGRACSIFSTDLEVLLKATTLRFLHLGMVIDPVTGKRFDGEEKARLDGLALCVRQAIEWGGPAPEYEYVRVDADESSAAADLGNAATVQRDG